MKPISCKRCKTPGLFWIQSGSARWMLQTQTGERHHCESDTIKTVKCKYCKAADLHWAEEIQQTSPVKKMILTESYGLPHACDERLAFVAQQRKDKKDAYAAIKTRVVNTPDGSCPQCNRSGQRECNYCYGWGYFSESTRRSMLTTARISIWPSLASNIPQQWGR